MILINGAVSTCVPESPSTTARKLPPSRVRTGKASGTGASITPEVLIPRLRALAQDKSVAAVVLRVDSPGGDALASDLMWREVVKLGECVGRRLLGGGRGSYTACVSAPSCGESET